MTTLKERYKNISKKELLAVCNKSKYVYIPLRNASLFVKKGDYVFKGMKIGKSKENYFPVFSSISGKVLEIDKKIDCDGNKIKCLKIENDFKEKREVNQDIGNINKISEQEFIDIIKNNGIKNFNINKENILIINNLTFKNHINNNYFLLKKYIQEILETIDIIMKLYNIKTSYIIISKKDKFIKKILNRFLGTYPKIKIYSKFIPNKKFLKSNNVLRINNLATIYSIYEALRYNQPFIHKYINLNNEKIINLKIGTPISDIINNVNNKKVYIVKNNKKKKINYNESIILDLDIDEIYF